MVEETTRPKVWLPNASKTLGVELLPRLSIQMPGGGSISETCKTETPPKSSADNPPATIKRWNSLRFSVVDRTWWWAATLWLSLWQTSRLAFKTNSLAKVNRELWWCQWCWCQTAACSPSPTCSNSWQPRCCPNLHHWTEAWLANDFWFITNDKNFKLLIFYKDAIFIGLPVTRKTNNRINSYFYNNKGHFRKI